MNPTTLQALCESIEHWTRLATGTRKSCEFVGVKDCALCQLFYTGYSPNSCVGCPVMQATKQRFCKNSPYKDASKASYFGYNSVEFKEAAQRELDFLKSLLPPEVVIDYSI